MLMLRMISRLLFDILLLVRTALSDFTYIIRYAIGYPLYISPASVTGLLYELMTIGCGRPANPSGDVPPRYSKKDQDVAGVRTTATTEIFVLFRGIY